MFWSLAAYAGSQTIRLTGNIVLTRLLLPEAFGLMALVHVLITGLEMISDFGLGAAVIQHRRGDEPAFRDTAWTLHVVRGVILWTTAALAAWPMAWFYGQADLSTLVIVAAATLLLTGLNSTSIYSLRRHLRLAALTVLELCSQAVGLAVMVVWAWQTHSVWALVAGTLATNVVTLFASHALQPGPRNRLRMEADARRALLQFGRWMLVSTLLAFAAVQIDRLAIGKWESLATLGVYSVAAAVAMLPWLLAQRIAGSVLYPLVAESWRSEPQAMPARLAALRGPLLVAGASLLVGILAEADCFFRLLYDAKFHDAGSYALWMLPWVWTMLLAGTLDVVAPAIGDTRRLAGYQAVRLVATAAGMSIGFTVGGLGGFLLGAAAGGVVGLACLHLLLRPSGARLWRQDAGYTLLLVALSLPVVVAHVFTAQSVFWIAGLISLLWVALICGWSLRRLVRGLEQ